MKLFSFLSKRHLLIVLIILACIGVLDAGYLTYKHYTQGSVTCSVGIFVDCGTVLQSEYSILLGIPVAVWGLGYYVSIFTLGILAVRRFHVLVPRILFWLTVFGFCFSLYMVYLQLVVLQSICLYCMVSAINSTLLCIGSTIFYLRKK